MATYSPTSALVSRFILGMRVDSLSYSKVVAQCLRWASHKESRYVAVATVNNVMESYDDPSFREIMNAADLVTSDGMPLVWGLKMLGAKNARRVYGPDLVPLLLSACEQEGIVVGFYGASEDVLESLKIVSATRWPKLKVTYWYSPPFRPLSPDEDAGVVHSINKSGAQIIFVGLSTPKQERWMRGHLGEINATMLGVGAAFDFLGGSKPQAPRWMMKCGLEWLFRLCTEPKRLWRRYLKQNPRFIFYFFLQLCGWNRY